MAILAIDVGDRKIGLAVGDRSTQMAWPRPPLLVESWDQAWPQLKQLVDREQIEQIVVGWPINTDGSHGRQIERVEEFVVALQRHVTIPIVRRDERQTSAAVQREQRAAGQKLKRGQEDSLAAQLIAESYVSEPAP